MIIKKEGLINLLLMTISFLISFGLIEAYVRFQGTYNIEGGFVVKDYGSIRPYHLQIQNIEQSIAEYNEHISESYLMYNPMTGWSPRPYSHSENGLYYYNSQGIRSAPQEYNITPEAGVVRIALFGDSFTHGDKVAFSETWGYLVEKQLNEAGFAVEVINFGVGGYGMDQALLRWREIGQSYQPNIVIFGLQMENVKRNVNLIRPLYRESTGIPFSKPRFILEDKKLRLINMPVIPPDKIVPLMHQIEAWPLVQYEYFYHPLDYQTQWWQYSKVLSLAVDVIKDNEITDDYRLEGEPAQVTLAIINTFSTEVKAHGADFLTVHLPRQNHLEAILNDKLLPYQDLLEQIAVEHPLIRPELGRLDEAKAKGLSLNPLYVGGGHYTLMGNEFVATAVTEYLLNHQLKR